MLIIDKFAYTNNLKDLSPKKKFGYSMGLLLASLINKEPLIFIQLLLLHLQELCFGRRFH